MFTGRPNTADIRQANDILSAVSPHAVVRLNLCFDIDFVIGYRRVPLSPARMIPFIAKNPLYTIVRIQRFQPL